MKPEPGQMVRIRNYGYPLEVLGVTRSRISAKYNNFYLNTDIRDVTEILPNPNKETTTCGQNSQHYEGT